MEGCCFVGLKDCGFEGSKGCFLGFAVCGVRILGMMVVLYCTLDGLRMALGIVSSVLDIALQASNTMQYQTDTKLFDFNYHYC